MATSSSTPPSPPPPGPLTQPARLVDRSQNSIIATVQVPAFPNEPQIVGYNGAYFVELPGASYASEYLAYAAATFLDVTSQAPT